MRLKIFEHRTRPEASAFKPHLPQLSSDEKELIMEQYFSSKKKMNPKLV
jgi:hypothetical protein